jgi:hypothetical protein
MRADGESRHVICSVVPIWKHLIDVRPDQFRKSSRSEFVENFESLPVAIPLRQINLYLQPPPAAFDNAMVISALRG